MIELIQFDFFLYPFKNSILAQTVFCKVVTLTERKNYNPLHVLKTIFPEENFEMDSENVNLIQKALIVIDELLHNLNADYFNGVLTYDRKVLKYNPAVLKAAHERVCARGNGK